MRSQNLCWHVSNRQIAAAINRSCPKHVCCMVSCSPYMSQTWQPTSEHATRQPLLDKASRLHDVQMVSRAASLGLQCPTSPAVCARYNERCSHTTPIIAAQVHIHTQRCHLICRMAVLLQRQSWAAAANSTTAIALAAGIYYTCWVHLHRHVDKQTPHSSVISTGPATFSGPHPAPPSACTPWLQCQQTKGP